MIKLSKDRIDEIERERVAGLRMVTLFIVVSVGIIILVVAKLI